MESVPEWLKTPQSYTPPADADRFLDKSIVSFLGLLSKIKRQSALPRDLFPVSPVLRPVGAVFFAVLVSASGHFTFVCLMLALLIVLLALLPGDVIRRCLRGPFIAAVFTYLVLLPSALRGSRYSITVIPAKVFACVLAMNLLSQTTRWDHLTGALRRLRFPELFLFVFDTTIRYIYLLGEFALQMLYALRLRSVGHNRSKYGSLGGIGGTLFLKSREMSERMYEAMECRGFTGEYRMTAGGRFTLWDAAYLLLNAGIVWLFVYFQKLL